MAKQSQSDIEQLIQCVQPINLDLVRRDIYQIINKPICELLLKVAPYCYDNGRSKELLCLFGTVTCQYRANRYDISVEIWLQQDYPNVAPLVYVKPTSDMYISPTNRNVLPDGAISIRYLRNWRYSQSNLITLVIEMSAAFGQSPPGYARRVNNHVRPYPLTSVFSNPSQVSALSNPSTSSSNALLSINHNETSNQTSTTVSSKNSVHRFSDIAAEPRRMLLPIQGFDTVPLVSLEEAIIPLVPLIPDVEQMVWIAKQNSINPKDGLSSDESASIMLYTLEWTPYEKSFYIILNKALRAANREELKNWFLYLRLIISAYEKLPSGESNVYRVVNLDLTDQYRRGDTIVWWGFSSCAPSMDTLTNACFLDKSRPKTFFSIESHSGKNIRSHSYYENEDEVLLLPGRQFEVIGCLNQEHGYHIVQLKETKPKYPLIRLLSS